MRRTHLATIVTVATTLLTACGGVGEQPTSGSAAASPPATVTVTSSPETLPPATVTVTASPSPSQPFPSSVPNSAPSASGSAAPTSPGTGSSATTSGGTNPPTPPTGAPVGPIKRFTLADAFNPGDEWEAKVFRIADEANVEGFGAEVGCQYGNKSVAINFRLEHLYKEVRFRVGQDNYSEYPYATNVLDIFVNGEKDDPVRFNHDEIEPVKVDVNDANVLELTFSLAEDHCRDGSYGKTVTVVVADMIASST